MPSFDSNVASASRTGAAEHYFRKMAVQQIGAQTEETRFVNRETVSCDDTVRSVRVSEYFRDSDASGVGGTGGVDYVDGTQRFVGDISSYGTGSKSNWYKSNSLGIRRSYSCDRCSYSATTSGNLRRHQLIHTEVRQFQCGVCATKFRQKTHLVRHVKHKHQDKDIHYQYAAGTPEVKVQLQQQQLQEIADDHTHMPLFCADCDFSAMSREELKQHENLHNGGSEVNQRYLVCQSRLKRHLLTRPFSCTLCDYRATQKEHLVRHMNVKHGEEPADERQRWAQSTHENIPCDDRAEQLAPATG